MKRGLSPCIDFDSVCTASDMLTFEAGMLLKERGISVPMQIPIAGFNDSEESRVFSPPLTTVHMPFTRQVICALRLLMAMGKGASVSDISLKTRLVLRGSCGCKPFLAQKSQAALLEKYSLQNYEYLLWKEKKDEQKLNLLNQELLCAKDMQSILSCNGGTFARVRNSILLSLVRDKTGIPLFRGGYRKKKNQPSIEMLFSRNQKRSFLRAVFSQSD